MDAPGLPEPEVAEAYAVLRRVNRQLGNNLVIDREAARVLAEDRPGSDRLAARRRLRLGRHPRTAGPAPGRLGADRVVCFALDRDPTAVSLAADGPEAPLVVRGDALRLPLPDRSIDLVTAVKFAHHFEGPALARLLSEMARVARRRVVVLDIRRHWLAYWGFVAWSRAFTRNRLVRHDGPLSVLRGFTAEELLAVAAPLAGFRWEVRRDLGFQVTLVGVRTGRIAHRGDGRSGSAARRRGDGTSLRSSIVTDRSARLDRRTHRRAKTCTRSDHRADPVLRPPLDAMTTPYRVGSRSAMVPTRSRVVAKPSPSKASPRRPSREAASITPGRTSRWWKARQRRTRRSNRRCQAASDSRTAAGCVRRPSQGPQDDRGEQLRAEQGHRHPLAAERIDRAPGVSRIEDPGQARGTGLDADARDGLPGARRDSEASQRPAASGCRGSVAAARASRSPRWPRERRSGSRPQRFVRPPSTRQAPT